MNTKKILFVCMGNICRSPTAEAVFRALVKKQGADQHFVIDSAGTHAYHVGSAPDARSVAAARKRGLHMEHLRARQVSSEDFDRFDYLVVMDQANHHELHRRFPDHDHGKIRQMMQFDESSSHAEVPDPYYGTGDGFELVLDLLEQASSGLFDHLTKQRS